MNPRLTPLSSIAFALILCAAATGMCVLLDPYLSIAGLTLIYVLAVVCAASVLPRWAGMLAAVCNVSALNYFFIPPRYSFRVDGAEYLLVLAVLMALSLGLNALISGLRSRGVLAETRRLQAEQLHALSVKLAECNAQDIASEAAQWMAQTLGLPCAVFVVEQDGNPGTCPGIHPGTALSCHASLDDLAQFHVRSATWAIANRRPLGRGCPDWGDLPLWCAPFSRHSPTGAVQLLLSSALPPPDRVTQFHWQTLVRQIGLCVDREHAAALARAALDSSRSVSLRNALLSSLSHDLRTPLAGILGSASTLREQGDSLKPAQRQTLLLNLENLARDMMLMADNTLQWARFSERSEVNEAGEARDASDVNAGQILKLQWESLEEVLGVAVTQARRRWQTPLIDLRVSADLPPVMLEAKLMLQVIANLLDNAARYGQPSTGRIVLQAGRSREGLFIAVRDHGPGLPPGDPLRLFERFGRGGQCMRADNRVGSGVGTGLGLSICQTIVQAHGGRIEARRCNAKDGGGAEFYIELPLCLPASEASKPIAGHADGINP